jgi:hypothetical protein
MFKTLYQLSTGVELHEDSGDDDRSSSFVAVLVSQISTTIPKMMWTGVRATSVALNGSRSVAIRLSVYHRLRATYVPSVALHLVEFPSSRGFESYLRSHRGRYMGDFTCL